VIGLRRGLFLGLLVGAITAVAGRFSADDQPPSDERTEGDPSTFARARHAAREEREATENRLRSSYDRARRSGQMPPRDD
jgi:hypothetical protein